MKILSVFITGIVLLFLSLNVSLAHHMAEGMVDEEVYEMIDALIINTPHAYMIELPALDPGMEPPDDGRGISADSVQFLENMIDDGLLDYVGMLDGDVFVVIDFNVEGERQTVEMGIYQYTP